MSKWLDHLKPDDWNTAAYKIFCLNINDSLYFYAIYSNTFASNMLFPYLMKMVLMQDFSSSISVKIDKKEMHATMSDLFLYNKWAKLAIDCIKNNPTIPDAALEAIIAEKYRTYSESKREYLRARREPKITKKRKGDFLLENLCLLLELFYVSVNSAMNSIRPLNIVPLHSEIFKMYRSIKEQVILFEQDIMELIRRRNEHKKEITEETYRDAVLKFNHAFLSATESYINKLFEARPALKPLCTSEQKLPLENSSLFNQYWASHLSL